MKRRVKADRLTPASPLQGALIQRLTDGVAPGFGHPFDNSFALAGEAVPFGHRNIPPTSTRFRRHAPPPAHACFPNRSLRLPLLVLPITFADHSILFSLRGGVQ